MQPAPVQKHACYKREVMIKRKAINKDPLGMGIFCGDKTKEIKEILQNILGEGISKIKIIPFKMISIHVIDGNPRTWNGVPEGYHD